MLNEVEKDLILSILQMNMEIRWRIRQAIGWCAFYDIDKSDVLQLEKWLDKLIYYLETKFKVFESWDLDLLGGLEINLGYYLDLIEDEKWEELNDIVEVDIEILRDFKDEVDNEF